MGGRPCLSPCKPAFNPAAGGAPLPLCKRGGPGLPLPGRILVPSPLDLDWFARPGSLASSLPDTACESPPMEPANFLFPGLGFSAAVLDALSCICCDSPPPGVPTRLWASCDGTIFRTQRSPSRSTG